MKGSKICEICAALFYMIAGAILLINWLYGGEYRYLLEYVSMTLNLGTVFLIGKMILSKVEYIYNVIWAYVTMLMIADRKADDSNEEK